MPSGKGTPIAEFFATEYTLQHSFRHSISRSGYSMLGHSEWRDEAVAGGLAVVEARWESRGNYGVRPLFEMISALTTDTCNPHAIRHDMFYEATSLEAVLRDVTRTRRTDAVYIGSHGEQGHIKGMARNVSQRDLIGILQRVNGRGRICGLYIGTCLFTRSSSAAALLDPKSCTGLQWIAGYRKEVDWLESAAADILFWSGYFDSDAKCSLTKAKKGADNLFGYMPKAEHQLGFGIFKWSSERGGVVPLHEG